MDSESEVREQTPREMKAAKVGDDPRAPWWVNYAIRVILVIGLPTALIGWREFKDYKYEGTRLEVEKKRNEVDSERNVIFSDFKRILYRVEKKLPDENR
jgi:ribosomal protein S30